MRAGYMIRVPLDQYRGSGHSWRVVVRVTPGNGEAIYLASSFNLKPVPETEIFGEARGVFLPGEGHYTGDLVLSDDLGRACSYEWKIGARFDGLAPGLHSPLAPGAIAEMSRTPPPARGVGGAAFERLSVMADFSDPHWREELTALLEQTPARRTRLVLFTLAHHMELFRDDDFHPRPPCKASQE